MRGGGDEQCFANINIQQPPTAATSWSVNSCSDTVLIRALAKLRGSGQIRDFICISPSCRLLLPSFSIGNLGLPDFNL